MSLVEIVRFADVHEADLAAAFLSSHGIDVSVTERFQTTVDPLMQRALGVRLMAPASQAEEARALLARAAAGEFAAPVDDEPLDAVPASTRVAGSILAVAAWAGGGFWGSSLPRRFRAPSLMGMALSAALVGSALAALWIARELVLNPP